MQFIFVTNLTSLIIFLTSFNLTSLECINQCTCVLHASVCICSEDVLNIHYSHINTTDGTIYANNAYYKSLLKINHTKYGSICETIGWNETELKCKSIAKLYIIEELDGNMFISGVSEISDCKLYCGCKTTPYEVSNEDFDLIIIVITVILCVILLLIAVGLILFIKKYKGNNQTNLRRAEQPFDVGIENIIPISDESNESFNQIERCATTSMNENISKSSEKNHNQIISKQCLLIKRSDLTIKDMIGKGYYGCVYKATLKLDTGDINKDVAVKIRPYTDIIIEQKDIEILVNETKLMQKLDHQNVLNLIGVCLDKNRVPMTIMPLMENGDLLSYIKNARNALTVKNLLEFGIQISKGMNYLSNQNIVHRDLAARNCMLDIHMCVKVADFGLSRDMHTNGYYCSSNVTALPLKWMSPESIGQNIYTTKSDVWSFGVVLWELLTRGNVPYLNVNSCDLIAHLRCNRLVQPKLCPDSIYDTMLQCWLNEANLRPEFNELEECIESVIRKPEFTRKYKKSVAIANVTYVNTTFNII